MVSLFFLLLAFFLVAFQVFFFLSKRRESQFSQRWQNLALEPAEKPFTGRLYVELPLVVQCYFQAVMRQRSILFRTVYVAMQGQQRAKGILSQGSFTAKAVFTLEKGVAWKASIRQFPLFIAKTAFRQAGEEAEQALLYHVFPVRSKQSGFLQQPAVRAALTFLWCPTAFLVCSEVSWEEGTQQQITVVFPGFTEDIQTLVLTFDQQGQLQEVASAFYDKEVKQKRLLRVFIDQTEVFAGCRLPARIRLGWESRTESWQEKEQLIITDLQFHQV